MDQPREYARSPGEVRFIYVGRLSPEKDVPTLLRAFALALDELPQARLTIVGDGPERARLEGVAGQLGCANRVRWLGAIAREGVRAELRSADVFVLPSRFESMSYTLLEAMACGVVCVATRVGGNADLIRHGETGMLVPSNDPPALADALRMLGNDGQLRHRLGIAAKRFAGQFRVESMACSTRDIYLDAPSKGLHHI